MNVTLTKEELEIAIRDYLAQRNIKTPIKRVVTIPDRGDVIVYLYDREEQKGPEPVRPRPLSHVPSETELDGVEPTREERRQRLNCLLSKQDYQQNDDQE